MAGPWQVCIPPRNQHIADRWAAPADRLVGGCVAMGRLLLCLQQHAWQGHTASNVLWLVVQRVLAAAAASPGGGTITVLAHTSESALLLGTACSESMVLVSRRPWGGVVRDPHAALQVPLGQSGTTAASAAVGGGGIASARAQWHSSLVESRWSQVVAVVL